MMAIASPTTRTLFRSFGVLTGLLGAVTFGAQAVRAGEEGHENAEARTAYSQKVAATYDFHWNKNSAFLPSLATTDNGQFLQSSAFPTSQYCGHCHEAAYHQWRESAHANANRAPWYKNNVHLLNAEKGIAFSRHCEGCHNPIALLSGDLNPGVPESHSYDSDALTCSFCHSIKSIDTRGTGSYVLGTPAVMVDENGAPVQRPVSDAEILAHLDRHSAAVMKPFYRSSDYCAACHKGALPKELTDYKWLRAMTPYDEWQNSSFAKESPLPFYTKASVSTCQTCHMQREALEGRDPGAKKGQLASHRWLGANSLIPAYYKYDEQSAKIRAFLQNDVLNIDLFALETAAAAGANAEKSSQLIAPLGRVPYRISLGEKLTVSVVIQNKGAAHSLVPEQRDMYEAWVDFQVRASGKVLAESGALQPGNNELDPSAHSFTNRLINKAGALNDLHQVWNNRVLAYNNTIQSGRSQLIRYSFTVPKGNLGPISITATVRYRRFDQHFIDFGMGKHYDQPVIDMASTTRTFVLGDNPADPTPLPGANPEWMRWNNYGIGLLDAQQYAAAVQAFGQVATMLPEYADAQTNIAIAKILWEKYDEALSPLESALHLSPENARALYYLALVERNQGNMDEAIANLQKVAAQFPRSRDAHRELGFSFYQQHRYDLARAEYEAVQSIDPDDLAAHYNLSILYRRLGQMDKAHVQAAYFADQKDDPTASTYALEYLRKHHEVAQESVPWHVHDLDKHGTDDVELVSTPVMPLQLQP
ncbi:MAG: tetratricopeptide repeat protein [Janthinobacterium lividum]